MLLAILAVTLTCTAPTRQMGTVTVWDEAAQESVRSVQCGTFGDTLRQLQFGRLWYMPLTGGEYAVVESVWAEGMQGRQVEFHMPGPGHAYVKWSNPMGSLCQTNVVYVPPLDPTGIGGEGGDADAVATCQLFDVRGALVGTFPTKKHRLPRGLMTQEALESELGPMPRRLASGVYPALALSRKGVIWKSKIVLLR
jgi:hypothetical protein